MRIPHFVAGVILLAGSALAAPYLGVRMPVKPAVSVPANVPNVSNAPSGQRQAPGHDGQMMAKSTISMPPNVPSEKRQSGDYLWLAFEIPSLPFQDTGTTERYWDDYDETCPYSGSTSPDVVYSCYVQDGLAVTVDMCGSQFDTKIYIYDADLDLVACNDDYWNDSQCGSHTSFLGSVAVSGLVYIVVDGCNGAYGEYTIEVTAAPIQGGGEDIYSATVIPALPYNDSGTTAGHIDDYDEVCPYSGSTAPDVVYSFYVPGSWAITVDLCGSSYDTKTYIYDANFNVIACNDDFYFDSTCGVYVSKIEEAICSGQIYIVIDGYYGAYGSYLIEVTGGPFVPCAVQCYGMPEGEPPLNDGYVDHYNGGCNTAGYPFQAIWADYNGEAILCGVSGWYLYNGSQYRDTDWFILEVGYGGNIEIVADAEQPVYIFELGPRDCATVGVIQLATAGDCAPVSMTIPGPPMSIVWFWVGPTVFATPPGEQNMFDYVVWFSGLSPGGIATEPVTWGAVKALYQ